MAKKTWQQLHKKAANNIQKVLEAATHKTLPITKTTQVRGTRHAGDCWRSRDELISDILLWTPSHERVKAGWPARTYIQQLCADTGCDLEDLLEAMDDREGWWERVRDISTDGATWWWWFHFQFFEDRYSHALSLAYLQLPHHCIYFTHTHIYIYIYIYIKH